MAKLPAFQFYPGDWMKDPGLRSCSPAARGLWIDLICLMWECEPRGFLVVNGGPLCHASVTRATGVTGCAELLSELEAAHVFSRTAEGVIYCRRMVRDEETRANARKRQKRHRSRNASVTAMSHDSSSSSSSSSSDRNPPTPRDKETHPPPEVTASDRYAVSAEVSNAWQELAPDRRRGGRTALLEEVAVRVRQHGEDAHAICGALVAYCNGPAGKDEHSYMPCNFIKRGMHLDPPESWPAKRKPRGL